MKKLRLVLSEAAIADILEQSDWYTTQSGEALAKRWEKSVTAAILRILDAPAAAMPCRFRSGELRDVRRTMITGFPKHLLFYRLQDDEISILRVVHGARDLENLL